MTDFIIIGHGLAGAVLAQRLLSLRKDIRVIDTNLPHSASEVSVGLVNPLIGPKLNIPYKMNECIEENNHFFLTCEMAWCNSFYSSLPLHRIFISKKQKERWFELKRDDKYALFIGDYLPCTECKKMGVDAPFGAGTTNQAYQLDVSSFLSASRASLQKHGVWDPTYLSKNEYYNKDKIIFCEGFRVKNNPLFNDLPFAPVKGETLQIKDSINKALSNGSWYLPNGSGKAIMGSTWEHENLLCGPTEKGQEEIIAKSDFIQIEKKQIESRQSGVRSSTLDRNPIIGVHEENKNCFIFNGFGSRGTSTIPYYSNWMAEFLVNNIPLPKEVNLSRFKSKN